MTTSFLSRFGILGTVFVTLSAAGCGGSKTTVSNADAAQRAYLGLDLSIDKAINLGMQGFNMASSANIADQTGNGDVMGTLVVGGQVDQGASANKTMNLTTTYMSYEDAPSLPDDAGVVHVVYDGTATSTTLSMKLMNIPNGTFGGTLVQTLTMSGDLTGTVTLNVAFTGNLESAGGGIQRTPGTTHVTGTATSSYGVYTIDVTR